MKMRPAGGARWFTFLRIQLMGDLNSGYGLTLNDFEDTKLHTGEESLAAPPTIEQVQHNFLRIRQGCILTLVPAKSN